MIDIHSHILPGIDDGSEDPLESLKMCRLAANLGCEAMIATPHQRHPVWWNAEPRKLQVLLDRIKKQIGDTIEVYLRAEIRVGKGFLRDLENFENAGLTSLAGSKYLLLEFERRSLSVDPVEVVLKVQEVGWYPIVAHPEFISKITEDYHLSRALVEAGALMQITAMSVVGDFGLEARKCVHDLLESRLAHFVASDCHGHRRRPPGLKGAFRKIKAQWNEDYARRLTSENPRAVLENQPVDVIRAGTTQA
jgi:protein-tyrosine phosphatase